MPPEAVASPAPSPSPAPAPAPAPVPAPSPSPSPAAPAPAGGNAPFYSTWEDADLRGWVENKKYDSPAAIAKAARESEKLLGVPREQLVRVPGADAKPEEWDAFYNRQGRPEKPDGYKLAVPEGDNGEFAATMAPILHKHGLTAKQAEGLANDWNQLMAGMLEQQENQAGQQSQADILNLKREWGNAYDQRVELARRAFRSIANDLGANQEEQATAMRQIENLLGSSALFIRAFSALGAKFSEATFHDGDRPNPNFGMTPEAAKVKLDELMADKDGWAKRFREGKKGSAEWNEWDRLNQIIASGPKAQRR